MHIPFPIADFASRLIALLPPEAAHNLTVNMMASAIAPQIKIVHNQRLSIDVAGLKFPNPVGLAAGFDKNAKAPDAMLNLGFGFAEVGAVTPKPQPGNAKPRVFRLRDDMAVINRYGFNNDGLDAIKARLAARQRTGIVGINLGANKNSKDRIKDYIKGLDAFCPIVDFCTINISSPNTPGLRALQSKTDLMDLLNQTLKARDNTGYSTPVFLKIAPDLTDSDKSDISECLLSCAIDGVIISNTTIERPSELISPQTQQQGGLSGAPLMEKSTKLVLEFYQKLGNKVPIIGVGGIGSSRDAYRKILAGASLVQLYTALIYQGPGLIKRIITELPEYLDVDGFKNISDAIGAQAR